MQCILCVNFKLELQENIEQRLGMKQGEKVNVFCSDTRSWLEQVHLSQYHQSWNIEAQCSWQLQLFLSCLQEIMLFHWMHNDQNGFQVKCLIVSSQNDSCSISSEIKFVRQWIVHWFFFISTDAQYGSKNKILRVFEERLRTNSGKGGFGFFEQERNLMFLQVLLNYFYRVLMNVCFPIRSKFWMQSDNATAPNWHKILASGRHVVLLIDRKILMNEPLPLGAGGLFQMDRGFILLPCQWQDTMGVHIKKCVCSFGICFWKTKIWKRCEWCRQGATGESTTTVGVFPSPVI